MNVWAGTTNSPTFTVLCAEIGGRAPIIPTFHVPLCVEETAPETAIEPVTGNGTGDTIVTGADPGAALAADDKISAPAVPTNMAPATATVVIRLQITRNCCRICASPWIEYRGRAASHARLGVIRGTPLAGCDTPPPDA